MSELLKTESENREYRLNRLYGLVAIPLLFACFFLIEHNWEASTQTEEVTGVLYDGSENQTADRQEGVNADSSSARILLAGFAMLGLGIPCSSRFKINSLIFWCIALHISWMMTTYLWATEPSHTAFKLAVLLVFTFTAFGLSRQLTLNQIGRVFAIVCVGFILIGFLAELRFGTLRIVGDYRFTGSKHPNTQAAYGSIACIAAALFYRKEKTSTIFISLFVFSVGFGCVLLTKSRTSLAAMVIGMTAFYAIRFRGMKRLVLVSVVTCGLALGGLFMTAVSAQMKGALGNAAAMGRSDDVGSLTGRLPLWEELMEWVVEKPIFGYGFLSMWTAERVEYLGDLFKWEIPHAHNMYLDVTLDGGIVGLSIFLLYLLVALFTSARRFLTNGRDGAAFCFALVFFALVHGTAESFFKQQVFVNLCLFTLMFRLAWSSPEDDADFEIEESVVESKDAPEDILLSV